jgi:putative endonuclease
MPYFVYILRSTVTGRTYVGQTEHPDLRLGAHNAGKVRSTRSGSPWERVYLEECGSRNQAIERELYFKSRAGRVKIRGILARSTES